MVEGVSALENESSGPRTNLRKTTLETVRTVKELQENSELSAFGIHAAFRQLGIYLSSRSCGQILGRLKVMRVRVYRPRGPGGNSHYSKRSSLGHSSKACGGVDRGPDTIG
jgi:hypothetical protein